MDYKQLAMDAILEACKEESLTDATDESVTSETADTKGLSGSGEAENVESEASDDDEMFEYDNGNGTTTVTLRFSLDPQVVKEQSRAIAKGVKREDMSDDISGDGFRKEDSANPPSESAKGEPQDEAHSPYESDEIESESESGEGSKGEASAEDKTPPDLFSDTLDSIEGVAMDARKNSRHTQTPLENCRAINKLFCPYHGMLAWQAFIDDRLKDPKTGIPGATAKVTFETASQKYTMSITADNSRIDDVKKLLEEVKGTRGILTGEALTPKGQKKYWEAPVRISRQGEELLLFKTAHDSYAKLSECVDDLSEDVENSGWDWTSNPDFFDNYMELIGSMNDTDATYDSYRERIKNGEKIDPSEWKDLIEKSEPIDDKYHYTKAQFAYRNITSPADCDKYSQRLAEQFADYTKKYHEIVDPATEAKKILFANTSGNFPKSSNLASTDWAEKYRKMKSNVNYTAGGEVRKDFDKIALELTNANGVKVPDVRALLGAAEYHIESYENNFGRLRKAHAEFMRSLYDWAVKDNNPRVGEAFPNGRP